MFEEIRIPDEPSEEAHEFVQTFLRARGWSSAELARILDAYGTYVGAKERERCAQVADATADAYEQDELVRVCVGSTVFHVARKIAIAIRNPRLEG